MLRSLLGCGHTLKRPRRLIGGLRRGGIHLGYSEEEGLLATRPFVHVQRVSYCGVKEYSSFAVVSTEERRSGAPAQFLQKEVSNSKKGSLRDREEWLKEKENLTSLMNRPIFDRQELLLFERLVEERPPSTTTTNHHEKEEEECVVIDISTLNQILKRWNHAWKDLGGAKSSNKNSRDEILLSLPTPQFVLRWIDSLMITTANAKSKSLQPNAETYRFIMDATLSQFRSSSSESRSSNKSHKQQQEFKSAFYLIESLFQRILRSYHCDLIVDDFHRVMHASIYFNKDVVSAERYLDELKQVFAESDRAERLRPTNRTYNIILAGWARENSPRQATACLLRMIDDGLVLPQKSNFETCLNAWVKCSSNKGEHGREEEAVMAGERAEILLLKMQELHECNGIDTKPCVRSIGKVVTAWASAVSKRKDAAVRAEAVLHFMQDLDWDNDSERSVKAIADAYLSIIRAYSLSTTTNKDAPEKCQALMEELKSQVGGVQNIPQAILRKLCSFLVLAWARSRRKDAAKRAEAAFHRIQRECSSAGVEFRPDRFCYGSLLEAWSREPNGERAEAIWNEMHHAYLDNNDGVRKNHRGSEILQPDTKSMNLVILAWGRSTGKNPDASRRAEEVFKDMTELHSIKPDVVSYNALLSALAGSKDDPKVAALRGEEYFRQLNDLHSRGDRSCRPTTVTYNQVIKLWSKVKSPESVERAQALLDEMTQRSGGGERHLQHNEQTFKAFSSVLACNGVRDKTVQELRFRQSMRKRPAPSD